MRPNDIPLAREIEGKLLRFEQNISLPGIQSPQRRSCFVEQLVDSIRRIKYVTLIRDKGGVEVCCNPRSELFDPVKAAAWHSQNGNIDEAFWLVFLLTHFGKNKYTGWGLIQAVYAGARSNSIWNWQRINRDFDRFQNWLDQNQAELKKRGNFGNHRKYQSLDAYKPAGTGSTIGSYIEWIGPEQSHLDFLNELAPEVPSARNFFNSLYVSMDNVVGFGRTAKFDYLTMLGKLGLIEIEPGSTYMIGATGPKSGATLLLANNRRRMSNEDLNNLLGELEQCLGLYFGMQVLEDALCNWQKSPEDYVYFNG